ncbi:hypothetical protein GY45DRAFT_231744 [Cubamyces sp. BRFM 1775]|nr:hypothetical protein GY45DRAFT_231744 [Cubamyces sp. BRFM 1775]
MGRDKGEGELAPGDAKAIRGVEWRKWRDGLSLSVCLCTKGAQTFFPLIQDPGTLTRILRLPGPLFLLPPIFPPLSKTIYISSITPSARPASPFALSLLHHFPLSTHASLPRPSFLATRSTICQPLPPCRRLLLPLPCLFPLPAIQCGLSDRLLLSPLPTISLMHSLSHPPQPVYKQHSHLASPFSPGPRTTCGLDCGTAQTRAVVWLYSTPAIDPASRPNPAM